MFICLLEDGHSGSSIIITKSILNNLIDNKPLTDITDVDENWNESVSTTDYDGYHCNRMSSLFKHVYKDGHVTYSDIDRFYCVDINDHSNTYYSNTVRHIIDELFPITMPYHPLKDPIKVYCEDFLTDHANGDFDTVAVYSCVSSDEKYNRTINRYFKAGPEDWEEISLDEYVERKARRL